MLGLGLLWLMALMLGMPRERSRHLVGGVWMSMVFMIPLYIQLDSVYFWMVKKTWESLDACAMNRKTFSILMRPWAQRSSLKPVVQNTCQCLTSNGMSNSYHPYADAWKNSKMGVPTIVILLKAGNNLIQSGHLLFVMFTQRMSDSFVIHVFGCWPIEVVFFERPQGRRYWVSIWQRSQDLSLMISRNRD